jgi:hypothetical protein
MFRSSLRDTGSIALTRGLMWFAVRTTAMVHGRFGKGGPKSLAVKVLQVAGIFVIGVFTAALPTVIAAIGLVIYWIASWIVALVWQFFERLYIKVKPNWPWPLDQKPKRETEPVDKELLVIIPNPAAPPDPRAVALRELLKTPDNVTNEAIEKIMAGTS